MIGPRRGADRLWKKILEPPTVSKREGWCRIAARRLAFASRVDQLASEPS
jgi:hypothetical protein